VQRHDGNTVTDKFTKPWINIAGDNAVGRFSKSVVDIKTITFFR
jgi:hypothetical protein